MTLTKERQGELAAMKMKDDINIQLAEEPLTLEKAEITVKEIFRSNYFLTDPSVTYAELLELYDSLLPNEDCRKIFRQAIANIKRTGA